MSVMTVRTPLQVSITMNVFSGRRIWSPWTKDCTPIPFSTAPANAAVPSWIGKITAESNTGGIGSAKSRNRIGTQ